MYTLSKIEKEELSYLELKSADEKSTATLNLNEGGRLAYYCCGAIEIISNVDASSYQYNYASAILFPFANRIKNGTYKFNGLHYILECNEPDKNNAIHGLVYNKSFKCINEQLTSDFGSVTLRYEDAGNSKGFPFKYAIELTYKLSETGISLSVNILNLDKNSFPFTLGWHPYFTTEDLYNSYLNFNSDKTFLVDNVQIPSSKIDFNETMPFQLKDTKLDDGYIIEGHKIELLTPQYRLKIELTALDNYLQVYTPKTTNVIAVEPMTGAADAFNNKIGLQILEPNDSYSVVWDLNIENLLKNEKPTNQTK